MNVSPVQIREAFGKVPRPIREFIAEGELAVTTQHLSNQYSLHIDTAGALNQLLTMVLLRFVQPSELPNELENSISIEKSKISGFIQDLNQAVFIPLQQKVRESGIEPSHEQRIENEAANSVVSGKSKDTQKVFPATETILRSAPPVSPRQTIPVLSIIPKEIAPQTPVTVQTPPTSSVETPPYNLIRPDVLATAPKLVMLHSMQADMNAVKHPASTQTLAPISTPSSFHPTQLTPARSFQTASVPYSVPPTRPFAVPVQSMVTPSVPVNQMPIAPAKQGSVSISVEPEKVKEYAADPYRESV